MSHQAREHRSDPPGFVPAAPRNDAAALLAADHAATTARAADLRRDLARGMEAAAGSNVDDEHDPEGATLAFERAQASALLAQAMQHLVDLDRAAERMGAGTYGTCECCGEPIAAARLQARPHAATCIGCAGDDRSR